MEGFPQQQVKFSHIYLSGPEIGKFKSQHTDNNQTYLNI